MFSRLHSTCLIYVFVYMCVYICNYNFRRLLKQIVKESPHPAQLFTASFNPCRLRKSEVWKSKQPIFKANRLWKKRAPASGLHSESSTCESDT